MGGYDLRNRCTQAERNKFIDYGRRSSTLYLRSIDGATINTVLSHHLTAYKAGTGILTTAQMAELVCA